MVGQEVSKDARSVCCLLEISKPHIIRITTRRMTNTELKASIIFGVACTPHDRRSLVCVDTLDCIWTEKEREKRKGSLKKQQINVVRGLVANCAPPEPTIFHFQNPIDRYLRNGKVYVTLFDMEYTSYFEYIVA